MDSELESYLIETNIGSELTIAISKEYGTKLSNLLDKLEKNKENLGIVNYAISSSTLEEVFLKLVLKIIIKNKFY